jgi:hypothetical protein
VAAQSLYWKARRIDIIEIIDQWYGPEYRYVKIKDNDGGLYILRFDEALNEWALIMFASARGQELATQTAAPRQVRDVPVARFIVCHSITSQ